MSTCVSLIDLSVVFQVFGSNIGYTLDQRYNNWRLGLGFTAVAIAVFGYFAPFPWPESRPLIAACVIVYERVFGINLFAFI